MATTSLKTCDVEEFLGLKADSTYQDNIVNTRILDGVLRDLHKAHHAFMPVKDSLCKVKDKDVCHLKVAFDKPEGLHLLSSYLKVAAGEGAAGEECRASLITALSGFAEDLLTALDVCDGKGVQPLLTEETIYLSFPKEKGETLRFYLAPNLALSSPVNRESAWIAATRLLRVVTTTALRPKNKAGKPAKTGYPFTIIALEFGYKVTGTTEDAFRYLAAFQKGADPSALLSLFRTGGVEEDPDTALLPQWRKYRAPLEDKEQTRTLIALAKGK